MCLTRSFERLTSNTLEFTQSPFFFFSFFKLFGLPIISQENECYLNIHYLIEFIRSFASNAFCFLNFLFLK